jgi:sensor histidine kinase YesM
MSITNDFIAFNHNAKKINTLFSVLMMLYSLNIVSQNNTNQEFTTIKNAPKIAITEINQDPIGYLWMATTKGLFQYDGTDFTLYNSKNSLLTDHVQTVAIKNDSLFIGSKEHLSIKVRNKFHHFKSKKINKIIFHNGITYLATDEGISYLNKNYLQPVQLNTQLDFAKINDIKFHENSFFIASNRGFWKVKQLLKPNNIQQLNLKTYKFLVANGTDLIAVLKTNKVDLFNKDSLRKSIKTVESISSISKIENEIWIASANEGIEVLEAKNYRFKRRINKYNSRLSSNEVSTIFTDRKKNNWINTKENGLIIYKNPFYKSEKPIIFLEDIKVSYQSLDSINPNNYPKVLKLKTHQSTISFHFKTANVLHPKEIEYRWKLNEKTSNWSRSNTITFRDLASDNYAFSVQSRVGGQQESAFRNFTFSVDLPLYRKTWFLAVSIGLLSLLFIVFILVYIRVLKRKNTQQIAALKLKNHLLSLEQKALQLQMNPHFIFNILNGIKAAGNAGKTTEMNATINKFATLLRAILNNSRTEDVSLKNEINTLKNYIELEQTMSSNSFKYQIKTLLNGIDADEILIPSMLIQPFIENSIKPGIQILKKEGLIILKFEVKNDFLHCSVDDNGIGLQKSKTNENRHESVSIAVNRERIENLSGKNSFSIKELKERENTTGTRVWFKIPLKTDY